MLELSIVLVIIGLIAGAVTVGQDLVRAAEVRATVTQIEKYNTAVNTFKGKYGYLPGDMPATAASAFGFFNDGMTGARGLGDGNGLIQSSAGSNWAPTGETLVFWRHLTDANLIDGAFGTNGNGLLTTGGNVTSAVTDVAQSLPPAKSGRGSFFIAYTAPIDVFTGGGFNFFNLEPIIGVAPAGVDYNYTGSGVGGLSPIDAANIDTKVDDGKPNTGIVMARGVSSTGTTASSIAAAGAHTSAANGRCIIGTLTTADIYNTDVVFGGNDPSCGLRARFN